MPGSPTAPSPRSTSPSARRWKPSTPLTHSRPTPKAPTCAGCGPRPPAGCSGTATAVDPPSSAVATRRSARPVASSPPPSPSATPCRPSTTTPPNTVTRIDRTSTRRSLPALTGPPLDSHHPHKPAVSLHVDHELGLGQLRLQLGLL